MPPEKYVEIFRNKYGKVEKGIIYNTARIFVKGEYYWNIKLLNTEPEYFENLIYNIMQILKEQEEENKILKEALKTLSKKFIIALGMYSEGKVKDFEELAQTQMNFEIEQAKENINGNRR